MTAERPSKTCDNHEDCAAADAEAHSRRCVATHRKGHVEWHHLGTDRYPLADGLEDP